MMYVDVNFANLLSSRLRNFKRKGEFLWNFSCNVCGDSKKNPRKARGYIFRHKTGLLVKCHKCGYSNTLGNFIQYTDPTLYQEYTMENYKASGAPRSSHSKPDFDMFAGAPVLPKVELTDSVLDPLKRLDKLSPEHPAVKYVENRKIPKEVYSILYFCSRFKRYVNTLIPNKFENDTNDHPRLIIPYFTNHGKCFAVQGRAFGKEDPKYMTIKIDETEEKIFGLDRVDYSKRIYITEGPLDSLFIPNAIAVSGSSFMSPTIKALSSIATVIYDNEPRSPTLTKLIKKSIDDGYSVCLWPETFEYKDINEAVMGGLSSEEIFDIINDNTFNGIEAELKFTTWKKCS